MSETIGSDLKSLRRKLHRVPEVGLHLPMTQSVLLEELSQLPIEINTGTSLSSIVGILRGTGPEAQYGPTVLLRADMDALPMVERTGLSYAAAPDIGAMHACGHDLHMAALVGAARILSRQAHSMNGNVLFMFQPGEEGHGGARKMLEEGLLQYPGLHPSAAYALHVIADMPTGVVHSRPGPLTAAYSTLDIDVIGRGAHGARPYEGADPMPVAAELVTAIYNYVNRRFNVFDPAIVTVGAIDGGQTHNVIPESVTLRVGLRSFSENVASRLENELSHLAHGIASAHGIQAETHWAAVMPPTMNASRNTQIVADTARSLFGADRYVELGDPRTGSEDFSEVLRHIPGNYAYIGAADETVGGGQPIVGNHSALSLFNDDVLEDAAQLLSSVAMHHFSDDSDDTKVIL